MKIQSTLIKEGAPDTAIVELTISAGEAEATGHAHNTQPQDHAPSDPRAEIVFLRVTVPANHPFLPGYQSDAIKRAITILETAQKKLPRFQS